MKLLVVGAGIAGLAIAWRLADRGVTVEIVERGVAGRGATWASAGMIAPGAELGRDSSAMAQLARRARAKWPSFAAQLERASGQSIAYLESGSLVVAQTAAEADALQARVAVLGRDGMVASWLPPEMLLKTEPLLSPALFGALRISGDAQVDNRALCAALCTVLENANISLREQREVRSLIIQDGKARGIVTAQGAIEADRIVLACGAWTNLIGGVGPESLPPVKPAKGQMVACMPPPGISVPQSLIWSEDVYLVPRQDRLFIGATVEDASFDVSVSHQARDRLLEAAARIIPALSQWRVVEMWAGLRPRTPDDAPVLGATAIDGLYLASGQFRNGILFAPAIAELMSGLIMGEPMNEEFRAFDPRRFAGSC
jgi:glycine oxidase